MKKIWDQELEGKHMERKCLKYIIKRWQEQELRKEWYAILWKV